MPRWASVLFFNDVTLTYLSSFNGKQFAKQWIRLANTCENILEIQSLSEIDLNALGQGGSPVRQRTSLFCRENFNPVRYEVETTDKSWSIEFQKEQIIVFPPGGEDPQVLPRNDAQYLIGSTGHQAVLLALQHESGNLNTELSIFLPDPLMTVPYKLTLDKNSDEQKLSVHSSHEEEFLLSQEGILLECQQPGKGIRTWLSEVPEKFPEWAHGPMPVQSRVKYVPPVTNIFHLEDVTISGPVTSIGATVTIPKGEGPFPAVLFLAGSGAHDRHGLSGEIDIGYHEIVDFLSEQGFVGLRYDSRGAGSTRYGKDILDLGLTALIADAQACLDYLRSRPEVDSDRIFFIGHSQGGIIALSLAGNPSNKPEGIVLIATPGRGLDEIMQEQLKFQSNKLGLSDEQTANQLKDLTTFIQLARTDQELKPGDIPDHLSGLIRNQTWLREHLENLPTDLIKGVRCPVLILQGEKDFQVSVTDANNLLAAARNADIDSELVLFPELDHLLKAVSGEKGMKAYYEKDRHVSREALNQIHCWLTGHS